MKDKPFSEAWSELTSKSAKLSAIEYEVLYASLLLFQLPTWTARIQVQV